MQKYNNNKIKPIKSDHKFDIDLRIKLAGRGQLIGWEDIIKGRNYSTSFKCYSNTGIVLRLSADAFINEVKKDSEYAAKMLNISDLNDKMTLNQISQTQSVLS